MEFSRKPKIDEVKLIKLLINKSLVKFASDWSNNLVVRSLQDGGMGSLILFPQGVVVKNRKFGETVSEYKFKDVDDVEVIVSLNVDDQGKLFELDIWKTDFSPLIKIPEKLD